MPIRSILVPTWPGNTVEHQLETALRLGRQLGAHLDTVFIRPDPAALHRLLTETGVAPATSVAEIEHEGQRLQAEARDRFEAWRERHQLAGELGNEPLYTTFACWGERVGSPDATIVQRGRLHDLIVLNFPGSSALAERAFDAAVFETGRPVLLTPKQVPDNLLRHVMVAWNGSLEATRAVASAYPLLHEAEQVTILSASWRKDAVFADDQFLEDLDLEAALEWQGVRARTRKLDEVQPSVGAALLGAARQYGATMLVLGGYTRSRVTEKLWGGVTRHVLHQADIPVLMAH